VSRDQELPERGLTLVELLVVMAIVAFLGAMLMSHLGPLAKDDSRRAATQGLVHKSILAIEGYHTELRQMPPNLSSLLATRTRTMIVGDPNDPRSVRTETLPPFLEVEKDHISSDGKEILDAWGSPLHYDPSRSTGMVWSDHVNGE
jgi:prepilin-type N-terminal cleavage/methylation domain-containing protein